MKAAVAGAGRRSGRGSTSCIYQLVSFRRGDELVRLSKRAGNIVTDARVVDEVGADAARFFFLARSADSQMEFDLDLAKKQAAENPVYYVQYAHARIAGILANAAERGIARRRRRRRAADAAGRAGAGPQDARSCRSWCRLMAQSQEPHHLPHYAQELATAFHAFYTECRVLDADECRLVRRASQALRRCSPDARALTDTHGRRCAGTYVARCDRSCGRCVSRYSAPQRRAWQRSLHAPAAMTQHANCL